MSERRLGGVGSRFAIATPHTAATAAGAAAFDAGGNAVDAALAAAAMLTVVYPQANGVGGDLFAIVREPEGRLVVVNASGAAPAAVDVETIRRVHGGMPEHGPHPVTVPGAVSGWSLLAEQWSALGLSAALAPAVDAASAGVPISGNTAADLAWAAPRLIGDPGFVGVFFRDGEPLREGDHLVQPALARSLDAIRREGPSTLYGGAVGDAIADHLTSLGAAMTIDDLAVHRPELDSAITLRYRDVDVSVVPPNSQGFVLLQALALIERLGIDPDPSGPDAGTIAEIFRIASEDRDRHNADPRRARVPIGTLLEDGHLGAMADAVAGHVREPAPPPPVSTDTIALLALDGTGLGISLIQSLSDGFGSGILEPRTGIILHNRGADFSLDPDHPNVLAGGKRPAHTLMPVVAHREDELVALAGTMGGGAQPQIDAMTLIRSLALGRSAADAVAEPRWLVAGMDLRVPDRYVMVEEDVPASAKTSLEAAGFELREMPRRTPDAGHAHLIRVLEDGTFEAGTDPRADGEVAVR